MLLCSSIFQSIDEYANRLVDSNHYASDEVRERRDGIMERRNNIGELSKARRLKLEESRKLQQFERDCDEVKSWITEKLKIASDESYKVRNSIFAHTKTLGLPNIWLYLYIIRLQLSF